MKFALLNLSLGSFDQPIPHSQLLYGAYGNVSLIIDDEKQIEFGCLSILDLVEQIAFDLRDMPENASSFNFPSGQEDQIFRVEFVEETDTYQFVSDDLSFTLLRREFEELTISFYASAIDLFSRKSGEDPIRLSKMILSETLLLESVLERLSV